jgi:transketolase
MYEQTEMRAVMARILEDEMARNARLCVMDADLARSHATLPLFEKYPERTINAGIAEANMACVAAGLASYGFEPFIFSFCPFVSRRICDQATVSIAYSDMNVKIVGTDPGIAAEMSGGTHMSIEDIGIMRSIPGMILYEPTDGDQLARAMPQIFAHRGPVYIRLFRKVPPQTFYADNAVPFDLLSATLLRAGQDVTLFASGIMVAQAAEAAKLLSEQGVSAELIDIHTVKPLDEQAVLASVAKTGCAVSCENHNTQSGLGSAVARCLARQAPAPMEMVGIQDRFGEVGFMPYLLKELGMSAEHIAAAALRVIERKQLLRG